MNRRTRIRLRNRLMDSWHIFCGAFLAVPMLIWASSERRFQLKEAALTVTFIAVVFALIVAIGE